MDSQTGREDNQAVAIDTAPEVSPAPVRRRAGCWRCGCWTAGGVLLLVILLGGWVAARQTGLLARLGLTHAAEDRQLSGAMNDAAAQELKAELVAAGFSDAGLDVAVMPLKEQGYNLAVVVMDASQGFHGNASGDLILESFKRLATGDAAGRSNIGRVALHYKDIQGNKLISLTAAARDIQAFANGAISRTEFLRLVEGQVDYGTLWGAMK